MLGSAPNYAILKSIFFKLYILKQKVKVLISETQGTCYELSDCPNLDGRPFGPEMMWTWCSFPCVQGHHETKFFTTVEHPLLGFTSGNKHKNSKQHLLFLPRQVSMSSEQASFQWAKFSTYQHCAQLANRNAANKTYLNAFDDVDAIFCNFH